MSDRRHNDDGGTKLSPQTLIVASLASLTAAIVTSTFWQRGTPITAAITPVIVAIASELYSRPARRITELGSRAGQARSRRFTQEVREREHVPTGARPERRMPDAVRPPDDPELGPVRIYRSGADRPSPVRRIHIRVALVTAAIAFVIAAAVLTLPELVFGGSVASHGRTTFFGGSHRHKTKSNETKQQNTQTTPTTTAPTTTTPTQSAPTATAPPAQTTPQTTTPSQQTPLPATPSPSTTTPAQTPAPSG